MSNDEVVPSLLERAGLGRLRFSISATRPKACEGFNVAADLKEKNMPEIMSSTGEARARLAQEISDVRKERLRLRGSSLSLGSV
jgi:hypothetical protein